MLYLMRHGESVVNIEKCLTCRKYDGDLTEKGRDQALRAARWFIGKGVKQIRTSPFHRTRQTAEIIGTVLGVMPEVDDDLREADCGDVEDLPFEDALIVWRRVYVRWLLFDAEARFPGGESYEEAVERVRHALSKSARDDVTLLVTHGDITHTVIPRLCINAAALQRVIPLHNTGIIALEHYDAERYSCSAWNLVEHLSD